jgi:hypothetical protein
MKWKDILKEEEEDLTEDVKRARERVKQGLPSKEMPLIPQFDDDSKKSSTDLPDETKEALEKLTGQLKEAFESIDHELVLGVLMNLNQDGKRPALNTTKKELVDMMVENTIKRLKSDRLYR